MVRRVRRSRAAALARAMGGGGGRGVRPGGGWRSGIDKWGEVGRAREWESAWRRDGRRAGAEVERSWREVNRRGRLVRRLSFTNTRDFFNLLASRCSAQTMNSSSWVLLHEQRPVALELASGVRSPGLFPLARRLPPVLATVQLPDPACRRSALCSRRAYLSWRAREYVPTSVFAFSISQRAVLPPNATSASQQLVNYTDCMPRFTQATSRTAEVLYEAQRRVVPDVVEVRLRSQVLSADSYR